MSITTKGGDGGETSLYSGERVKKSALIMEVLGTLDELNSWMGLIKSRHSCTEIKDGLNSAQLNLFNLCSAIATDRQSEFFSQLTPVSVDSLNELEDFEELLLKKVKMPDTFIVPGTNENSGFCDIARTVCRRAERRLNEYVEHLSGDYFEIEKKYINRLSDVLFIVARSFEDGAFQEKL